MQIVISELEVFAYHGVNPEEKENGQPFLITAEIDINATGHLTDTLLDTVNYSSVCKLLVQTFLKSSYNLIERTAFLLARAVLEGYPEVYRAVITVKKPNAPIKQTFGYVAAREERSKSYACLALGSNLGDKKGNIESMLARISELGRLVRTSKVIETKPFGEGTAGQPSYLNAAVLIETVLLPHELLMETQRIERQLGRTEKGNNAPRTADIDILLYAPVCPKLGADFAPQTIQNPHTGEPLKALKLSTPTLTLPHLGITRPFLTHPLKDVLG